MSLLLQGPPTREYTQMLHNEGINEGLIPARFLQLVRVNAKQMRASRDHVAVLLHNGEVFFWRYPSQTYVAVHLHGVDSLSTNSEGSFIAQSSQGHAIKLILLGEST